MESLLKSAKSLFGLEDGELEEDYEEEEEGGEDEPQESGKRWQFVGTREKGVYQFQDLLNPNRVSK